MYLWWRDVIKYVEAEVNRCKVTPVIGASTRLAMVLYAIDIARLVKLENLFHEIVSIWLAQ